MSKGLPSRNEDFSGWYNELVKKADLAENCGLIKFNSASPNFLLAKKKSFFLKALYPSLYIL